MLESDFELEGVLSSPTKGNLLYEVRFGFKAVSKDRPRAARGGHFYTPKKTRDFEKLVRDIVKVDFEDRPLIDCPLHVEVLITEPIPKSYDKVTRTLAEAGYLFPPRGDTDNKVKAITDALNGVAYVDDSQNVHINASKKYGQDFLIVVRLTKAGLSHAEVLKVKSYLSGKNNGRSAGRSPKMG